MEALYSFVQYCFAHIDSFGVIGSLLFTAYTVRKDQQARRLGNLLAMDEQYDRIWSDLYSRPDLNRILKMDVDTREHPVSNIEQFFVRRFIFHVDAVRHATRARMFFDVGKIKQDIGGFFARPIAREVWEKVKPFQSDELVVFMDDCLDER